MAARRVVVIALVALIVLATAATATVRVWPSTDLHSASKLTRRLRGPVSTLATRIASVMTATK